MNKREHVLNAALLAAGLGVVLRPAADQDTARLVAAIFVPVVLGALVPDVDSVMGHHRKTFHNLAVLGVVAAYPVVFDNLQYVWIGVVSHLVLDLLGTTRGVALLYPLTDHEYDVPVGVSVDSVFAGPVTLAVTLVELAVAAVLVSDLAARLLAGVHLPA